MERTKRNIKAQEICLLVTYNTGTVVEELNKEGKSFSTWEEIVKAIERNLDDPEVYFVELMITKERKKVPVGVSRGNSKERQNA